MAYPEFDVSGKIVDREIEVTDDTRSVIVGPTDKGPAFIPTAVGSQGSMDRVFGSGTQTAYAAREQIREGGVPRVMRILQTTPWNPSALFIGLEDPNQNENGDLYEFSSSLPLDFVTAAVIVIDREDVADAFITGSYEEMDLVLINSSGVIIEEITVSMDPGSPRYFAEILRGRIQGVNVHANFVDTQTTLRGETIQSRFVDDTVDFSRQGPKRATTPWVLSQSDLLDGRQRLFRFHLLEEAENRNVKVSIANIRENTFDVVVRDYTDSDFNPEVLEEYKGLVLDRDSEQFIGRQIGNDVAFYEDGEIKQSGGQYDVESDFIRVEMAGLRIPDEAYPYGFEGYEEPAKRPQGVAIPKMPLLKNRTGIEEVVLGARRRNIYLGTDVSNLQSRGFSNPIPVGTRKQDDYVLEPILGNQLSDSDVRERKFTIAFQGGYGGSDPYKDPKYGDEVTPKNVQGLDCSSFEADGTEAYETALGFIEDLTGFGLAHLATPGIIAEDHKPVATIAQSFCRERKDCIYTFQVAHENTSVENIIGNAELFGGSFSAAYYLWFSGGVDWDVPLGDLVPAIYAQNDNQATPAKAPAGLRRGVIPSVSIKEVLAKEEREELLENGINHAAEKRGFIVAIGNRTQRPTGAFSQLNVRRGVNFVKFEAQRAARNLLFEPNNAESRNQLQTEIQNALESLARQGGIQQFSVTITSDRNEIQGSIALQFQDIIESVVIDFAVRRDEIVFV